MGGGLFTIESSKKAGLNASDSALMLATIDVIKSGAHMTKNRAMYSLSNAAVVK